MHTWCYTCRNKAIDLMSNDNMSNSCALIVQTDFFSLLYDCSHLRNVIDMRQFYSTWLNSHHNAQCLCRKKCLVARQSQCVDCGSPWVP